MRHNLKIYPQYYCRVADGTKTFEVRANDRGFQPGDTVHLSEWDPSDKIVSEYEGSYLEHGRYTNSETLIFRIGYVLPIGKHKVVFSLLKLENK